MQTITDDLREILKERLQVGATGFRARLDVSEYVAPSTPLSPRLVHAEVNGYGTASFLVPVVAPTPGNLLVFTCGIRGIGLGPNTFHEWNQVAPGVIRSVNAGGNYTESVCYWKIAEVGDGVWSSSGSSYTGEYQEWEGVGELLTSSSYIGAGQENDAQCGGPVTVAVDALIIGMSSGTGINDTEAWYNAPAGSETELFDSNGVTGNAYYWVCYQEVGPGTYDPKSTGSTGSGGGVAQTGYTLAFSGAPVPDDEDTAVGRAHWNSYQVEAISIEKSLRTVVDQAEVTLDNEGLPFGWGPGSIFRTNQRIRIYQWYGGDENVVRSFTGVIDKIHDGRDVLTTTLSCRDMMALLRDPTFSAIGPQGADEEGAIRTVANGVYLSMEVSDIVYDIVVNQCGWPVDDVDITPTSYVLDEFRVNDGQAWAEAIIGDAQLTGLVGYSAWSDEEGVFHFAPTLASTNFTDPPEPVYVFRAGEDITELGDETDQYELVTRIKARGPLTTTTLQDTWRELWRTTKIHLPVGVMYRPSEPANIYVVDRGTDRLYCLRQSDRAVIASAYLGGAIAHPLGLSGDPADASIYWVLNAPWIDGGSGGNSIKKVRKSDNHVLASYSIPSGRWSALKVSSSYIWLTNLDTDRFYKRSKTDASAIADYSHTYSAVVQANPSGIMVDGTTLYLFWANGGTTARFLKCDESAPGTITGVVKTAGTTLHGGEMDTTTHTECYGDSDSLGLVAKFTLLEAVDQTDEVSTEAVNGDLEDELGELALWGNRLHDAHPDDDPHPFEMRRLTLDLTVVTSIAQANETALRQLELGDARRRILDVGIVGNPALQKTDLVAVVDPVSGISDSFVIDTYRTTMSADSTYLGTIALLPVESFSDEPEDLGDAVEDL